MAKGFTKMVKNARRGKSIAKRFKHRLIGSAVLIVLLLTGATFIIWWQEYSFEGSFWNAFWSVLFTLIGQGEFASSPSTILGRLLVFTLSILGVALFGVFFSEILQRIIDSRLKEMMGMSYCKFKDHIVICGWNSRGKHIVAELMASERNVAVLAEEKPLGLPSEVFFILGKQADSDSLAKTGLQDASGAIILSDDKQSDDSRTILTALAVKSVAPNAYTVIELRDPKNALYASYARVDDIIYSDQLIADITAICTHCRGLSSFIRDVLSADDDGHSFTALDVPDEYDGKTVAELFRDLKKEGLLPVGLTLPPPDDADINVSQWISQVNPDEEMILSLPLKAVCLQKNRKRN